MFSFAAFLDDPHDLLPQENVFLKGPITASEKNDLDRLMLIWANTFPEIPENVRLIEYEYFAAKTVGMALSAVQGSYVTKRYITGGYQAEYSFEVHYKIAPPGGNDGHRLQAVELLNAFGDWAETQRPDIGAGRNVVRIRVIDRANYIGATEDHYEDYLIPLKLTYEVNV